MITPAQAYAQLRYLGDPVLRTPAAPVSSFDGALMALVERMAAVMAAAGGAGLAAPQIGVLQRVLVFRQADGSARALVNPRVVSASDQCDVGPEGCLSLPGVELQVERARAIRVEETHPDGAPVSLVLEGMQARVVQHELDHLDGVLIVDRATGRERVAALLATPVAAAERRRVGRMVWAGAPPLR